MPRHPRHRRRRLRAPGALLATILLAGLLAAASGFGADAGHGSSQAAADARTAGADPPAARATAVSVHVDLRHPGAPIGPAYLGLSYEATDLPRIAAWSARGDLVSLLRSLGPGILRFGGVSADTRIAWTDARTPAPAWASAVLTATDFQELRTLAQRSGWRVLLTLGLAHYEPQSAAREAAAAKRALGPWLAGIEIGNEPDAYERHGLRPPGWGFAAYEKQVRAYERAIDKLAPGIPLDGPGVSGSHVFAEWGPREAARDHPALLTGHHYPLGCHQLPAPSIERLLSAPIRTAEQRSLARYMAVAHSSGIPFRMDEANSVSCGGQAGISNTFAAALWGAGYIGQALTAGVAGLNFQGNPANCSGYTALCASSPARLAAGQLSPQPLWYALVLTRGLSGFRPLPSTTTGPGSSQVAAFALREPGGALRFLLVAYSPSGAPPAAIDLRVGAGLHEASIEPMTAPDLAATSDVRIGGAAVAADGTVSAARVRPLAVGAGHVRLRLPAASAAIVTVAP